MRFKYTFLVILIILITGTNAWAQADIGMATHWYNRASYNPAVIARTDFLYLFSNIRQQWPGVDGAPQTFNVQVSGYIQRYHAAFGLSLVGDKVGVTQSFNPVLNYAFKIANHRDWSFSMGLSAGVFTRSVNGSLLEAVTDIDPSIQYDLKRIIRPDANAGFEFQNTHFIFSISCIHLFSLFKSDNLFINSNHRYGSLIYKNTHSGLYSYYLGIQVVNRNNLTVLEGNAMIRFKHPTGLIRGPTDLFDLGLTYRTSRMMALLFGLNISPDFRIGYVFNQSFITGYYPNGTHEIMLEYRIRSRDR